ncbi:Aminodeoxychorismate synthase [Fusarium albosuccineum]|uniref:Aminodeoxychorismate synthase n=1 Tax=Fusarium albosuccineum TaxID=1237068 RepID=A0A8H4LCU0_9HYPO|nr:Aminodeoxychorismate synthase [Fusarium albosuccineum]
MTMPQGNLREASTSEAWGKDLEDFKIGGIINRQAQPSSARPKRNGKRKREASPKPKLAALDEYQLFTEDLTADMENLDDSLSMLSESEDCDSETLDDANLRIELSAVNKLAEDIEATCGPTPDMDSIPNLHQRSIENHDSWYMSILDSLFNEALAATESTVDDSPLSRALRRWLKANSDIRTRNGLAELLLHPHMRSFRTRAALGQCDQRLIFDILETFPLSQQGEGIPNVIGIYLLYGPQLRYEVRGEDLVYVGQTIAMRSDPKKKRIGIRLRSTQHWQSITKCRAALERRAGIPARSDILWAHRRLASPEIGETRLAVLSVFPFPTAEMGSAIFHYAYLLTLAETIDAVFLASYQQKGAVTSNARGSQNSLPLRPRMPQAVFEGLNRELPSKQDIRRGLSILSIHWSPDEINTFIHIVQQNQSSVYHHMTCNPGVQWDTLVKLLQAQGIVKSRYQIYCLYRALQSRPDLHFTSYQTSHWRFMWAEIFRLKEHLEKHKLIKSPNDDNDIFYHIPALEDGYNTADQIRSLLSRTGFKGYSQGLLKGGHPFLQRHLPSLLHRDVWEKVTEIPPSRVSINLRRNSRYLATRTAAVLLHHARRVFLEQGVLSETPTFDERPIPAMSWPVLLEIWHRVQTDLLADDVPQDRILEGGLIQVGDIWRRHRPSFWESCHSEPLPDWTYDPSMDRATIPLMRRKPAIKLSFSQRGNMCGDSEPPAMDELVDSEESYEWPSDTKKYEVLASSVDEFSLQTTTTYQQPQETFKVESNIRGQNRMAQHRPSTFRILTSIMRKHHELVFRDDSSNPTDNMFWETLYIGALDKWWRIVDQRALQLRFGWVLDYIRTGSLSPEAQCAKEILQQALVDILARSKHPYTYDTGLSTATHLNPDLCTHWTGEFLSVSGALPKVKLGIQNFMQGFGIRGFCSTFGILIALLWEETASICHPDITADDDRQVVPSGDEDHREPISTLQSFRSLVSALSTDHIDSDEMVGHGSPDAREQKVGDSLNSNPEEELITARRLPQSVPASVSGLPCATSSPSPSSSPMSPPPYAPLQHHSRTWHAKEDEYLRYLLECDITWSQRHIKFQGRFGTHRSMRSLKSRCKTNLQKDCPSFLSPMQKDWTSDEIQCLQSLLETERSWDDVATKLEEKFNNGRTMGAMKLRAQIRKMDTSRFNNEPWTAEQED